MTKSEFLRAVADYASACVDPARITEATRMWGRIVTAVNAHWLDGTVTGVRIGTCTRPPRGWFCTKDAGHTGPCPTWPSADAEPFQVEGTWPATMPDLTSASRGGAPSLCSDSRCLRDAGHKRPMAAGPARWTGEVTDQDATLRMLGPDEHMDRDGRIWK